MMKADLHREISRLVCVGMNHKSAPLRLREKVYVPPSELAKALSDIQQAFGFSECVLLSTCNRFDIYAVLPPERQHDENELVSLLYQAFRDFHQPRSLDVTEDLDLHLYCRIGHKAVEHILGVASSLDSLIIGETQITSQFKQAWQCALEAQTLGPHLSRLGQEALGLAKKIRSQTAIGQKTVSISHAALDLAKPIFGDLKGRSLMIIGAGEMAKLAALYAVSKAPKELIIVNRSLDKAQQLISCLNIPEGMHVRAHAFDDLAALLLHVDVLVSATAARTNVIDFDTLAPIVRKRKSRPLCMVDIAIPRDIDPRCGELEDVFLFDIDDLKQLTDDHLKEREAAMGVAQTLLLEKSQDYALWLKNFHVKPYLEGFRLYLDTLIHKECERTFKKDMFKDLKDEQILAIDRLLISLADKITADMAITLKDFHR